MITDSRAITYYFRGSGVYGDEDVTTYVDVVQNNPGGIGIIATIMSALVPLSSVGGIDNFELPIVFFGVNAWIVWGPSSGVIQNTRLVWESANGTQEIETIENLTTVIASDPVESGGSILTAALAKWRRSEIELLHGLMVEVDVLIPAASSATLRTAELFARAPLTTDRMTTIRAGLQHAVVHVDSESDAHVALRTGALSARIKS